MSGKNFGSWPTYNARKVLLEGDTRLILAPTAINLLDSWTATLSGSSTVLDTGRLYDLTAVTSIRLQYELKCTNTVLLITSPSAVYLVVDFQQITDTTTWTPLLAGPVITSSTPTSGVTVWTGLDSSIAALGDVRLRLRAVGTSGANLTGVYAELQLRYNPALLGGSTVSVGNWAQATVDFGFPGGGEDSFAATTVTAPWVTASSRLICTPAAVASADHDPDDAAVEGVQAYATNIVPGVGFDIVAGCRGGTWGRYLITAIAQ